jgi:Annexin
MLILLVCSGAGQFGTDESTFNSILATRSWPYLRQLMADYQAITGKTLESAVKAEFSANAEKGLLAIRKFHSPQLSKERFVIIGLFHSAMCQEPSCLFGRTDPQRHQRSWNKRPCFDSSDRQPLRRRSWNHQNRVSKSLRQKLGC